mmetsp:Transcript_97752/g.272050  ORF Transcript_97752/g.272050 Transcript_97752/m.272050 type:complete len:269 (+) Transcript_97752:107-913(+)
MQRHAQRFLTEIRLDKVLRGNGTQRMRKGHSILPPRQEPCVPVQDHPPQPRVEQRCVSNLQQDHALVLIPGSLHVLNSQVLQPATVLSQTLLRMDYEDLQHVRNLSLIDLRHAPRTLEQVELTVHSHHVLKGMVPGGQQRHHVIELVHLAAYAFAIWPQRRRVVPPLGVVARAGWARHPCGSHPAQACMLVHAERAHPVAELQHSAALQLIRQAGQVPTLQPGPNAFVRGEPQCVGNDGGHQVGESVGPRVRHHALSGQLDTPRHHRG